MKKLISLLTALICIISLTSCNTTSSELQSQINELQSQVSSLKSEVSPSSEPIPEENIPKIDLRALADKIVKECPPPEGVELVYDTENVNQTFNIFSENNKEDKKFMDKYFVDTTQVVEFIKVYNPKPDTGLYYFVIAKINSTQNINYYKVSANTTTKQFIKPYIQSTNEHPSDYVGVYIYSIVLSNTPNDPINLKAEKLVHQNIN